MLDSVPFGLPGASAGPESAVGKSRESTAGSKRVIRIDRNGDGVESEVEKKLAQGVRKARELMQELDRDGSGSLEGAEVDSAPRGMDRDGDGTITMREGRRHFNKHIGAEERFRGFDSTGDGVLSGEELSNQKWAEGRDLDGDGTVSLEEFVQGRRKMAEDATTIGPGEDPFVSARLDRNAPPKVSWYHPHRKNETPTLRISGNVTADNFWREAALASMNVGMSPRRMASVLQEAMPRALEGLGVRLDSEGQARLGETIRKRTSGLPRANPIPHDLHPDTTGKYLDHNPAAAGWREKYGPSFDRMLA
ncbi:MAG: hypothetical protein FJY99_08705 [Candidatus Sericytochromatia bacterium]|nr:hypothetical protein [Candidatus Tanganyikabacteria bacterium]